MAALPAENVASRSKTNSRGKTKQQVDELYSPEKDAKQKAHFFDDGTRTFFWRAHTISVLVVISIVLLYVSLYDVPGDSMYNIRRGAMAVVVVFILIGVIHMPDGPFIRPHPAIWRFALCIMIVYVLLLIFTLFQSVDDARQFLQLYDPDLGTPLPERTYANECDIYTPGNPRGSFANFMDKMDVFVPCHLFGWYLKALILRDVWLLNVISIGFELMEYTLECQLPNFGECWWDHWILDFIVCNGLGIVCGMITCHYLSMKTYHWSGLWKIPSFKGKLKRAMGQFTPYNWDEFQWGYTESFKRFVFVVAIVIFWMMQELNVFYLKSILWIPPNHSLNLYREIIYGGCGACAINEMYHYIQSSDPNTRIGRFSWLVVAALLIETMIDIKFGWEIITIVPPIPFLVGWGLFALLVSIWAAWKFTYPLKEFPIIRTFFQEKKKRT